MNMPDEIWMHVVDGALSCRTRPIDDSYVAFVPLLRVVKAEARVAELDAELAECQKELAATENQGEADHAACLNYEARIHALEAALRELRTCNEPGCKLCFACLLHIERHVTPLERA